jgi:hypothetical protein
MAATLALALRLSAVMPDLYFVAQGERFAPQSIFGVHAEGFPQTMPTELYSRAGNIYQMQLSLPAAPSLKRKCSGA